MSSKKSHISSDSGFRVPKDYFKNFKVDPLATNFPEETGFKVPDAYFESLTERILQSKETLPEQIGFKVSDSYFENFEVPAPGESVKVVPLFKRKLFKIVSLAAAASLLYFVFTSDFFQPDNKIDFNSLSANEIESWFIENPNSISNDELADVFIDTDSEFISDISEEELSDYLMQTDIESLIDEN